MAEGVSIMAESAQTEGTAVSLLPATEVARQAAARVSANGIHFASFADNGIEPGDLDRLVQAVPEAIAAALGHNIYYFVPLVLAAGRAEVNGQPGAQAATPPAGHRGSHDETMVSATYTAELAELAICHRNVDLPAGAGESEPNEGVFISTRLLSDRFSLAFEFFINVGHAFVDAAGVAEPFAELAWKQAMADVRGETSHDAWETRALARNGGESSPTAYAKPRVDEKSRNEFLEAAFADSVAIYLLSLATDFDYSELREREYPLLAPNALAERLRLVNRLFPPNAGYDFAIRYRRRA
jgi:hypothetical protein